MGPAFIAAIGYIDPGNFATNIQAGASFGYKLLWVVVWANLMAMLIQMLSAKLGIATGKTRRNRSAIITRARRYGCTGSGGNHCDGNRSCRIHWCGNWFQADPRRITAAGGGAYRHCHLPYSDAAASGQKPLEKVIGGLLLFVAAAYIVELIFSQPNGAAR